MVGVVGSVLSVDQIFTLNFFEEFCYMMNMICLQLGLRPRYFENEMS